MCWHVYVPTKHVPGIIYRKLAANFSSIDLDLQDLARSIKCNRYSYRNLTSSTGMTIDLNRHALTRQHGNEKLIHSDLCYLADRK